MMRRHYSSHNALEGAMGARLAGTFILFGNDANYNSQLRMSSHQIPMSAKRPVPLVRP